MRDFSDLNAGQASSMSAILSTYSDHLPPALRHLGWQTHPLDGALLLFERDTGLNVKLEGEETADLQRTAPRTLLIAVTNICNLQCPFCYRDLTSPSAWTYESLLEFCQQASDWGVLEVAFGGGEPTLFKDWAGFINTLYATSRLCINFTTNGMFLSEDFLRSVEGKVGNIRLSLYDTNHWAQTIERLVGCGARFGVNWLITPDDLPTLETKFLRLLGMGVRDFLLLSYKGSDMRMHFRGGDYDTLAALINKLHAAVGDSAQIKLDSCWGEMLPSVPRLFDTPDCGAGDDFLSITSDKHIKPCSFHHWTIPFETLADVRRFWVTQRRARLEANIAGCARLPLRALPL
jgi:hypothetical protein